MPRIHEFERSQLIQRPSAEVFAFFADAANLEAITPQFLRFRSATRTPIVMHAGTCIDYELSLFGFPLHWKTRIVEWQAGVRFVDEQESGPYALWRHRHEFEARGHSTLVRDHVQYSEPLGPLGALAHVLFIERTLTRTFDFRQDATARLLGGPGVPPLPS